MTKRTDLGPWSYAEIKDPSTTSCVLTTDEAAAQGHLFVEANLLPRRFYEVGRRTFNSWQTCTLACHNDGPYSQVSLCVESEFGKCMAWSYTCARLTNVTKTNDCFPEPPLGNTFQLSRLDNMHTSNTALRITWKHLSFPENGGSPITDYQVGFFLCMHCSAHH